MLIKTTHDEIIDNHFFIVFSDEFDTKQDHDVSTIYYKTWAMNIGSMMMLNPAVKINGKHK